jgi:hypothetical protein
MLQDNAISEVEEYIDEDEHLHIVRTRK